MSRGPALRADRWVLGTLGAGAVMLVLLVVAVVVAANRPEPDFTESPFPEPPRPQVAVVFGDSYFNGSEGVTPEQAMGAVAVKELGFVPAVRGAGGSGFISPRTAQPPAPNFLGQIEGGELDTSPAVDVPLVLLGGGLLDQRHTAQEEIDAVAVVVERVRSQYPKAQLVLLGPPNHHVEPLPQIQRIEDAQRVAADELGIAFITFTDLVPHDQLIALVEQGPDGVHPNAEGHRLLGERLAAVLQQRGVHPASTATAAAASPTG